MTLLELYRFETWATLQLLEFCRGVDKEHLYATVPGVFGTAHATLQHLVGGEEGYFAALTGERLAEPLPRDRYVPLEELAERIRRMGPRWEALAQDSALAEQEIRGSDGWRFPAWVVLAQAIHHAGEHRVQVLSILGSRGLEVPELGVWDYADELGVAKPPEAG